MYLKSAGAIFSAVRMLFRKWTTLPLLITVYAALLLSLYLFVSTREATVTQLTVTFAMMLAVPLLFFLLQAASVNYATATEPAGLLRKAAFDCLKLVVVSSRKYCLNVTGRAFEIAQTPLPRADPTGPPRTGATGPEIRPKPASRQEM